VVSDKWGCQLLCWLDWSNSGTVYFICRTTLWSCSSHESDCLSSCSCTVSIFYSVCRSVFGYMSFQKIHCWQSYLFCLKCLAFDIVGLVSERQVTNNNKKYKTIISLCWNYYRANICTAHSVSMSTEAEVMGVARWAILLVQFFQMRCIQCIY